MATLLLKDKDIFPNSREDYSEVPIQLDDLEFIEFRKNFYMFQYEFYSRSNINDAKSKERLAMYYRIVNEKTYFSIFGTSNNNIVSITKYTVDLYVDYSLSIRRAKEVFKESAGHLWNKIENAYRPNCDHDRDFLRFVVDYPTTANGKKANVKRLFKVWGDALAVFDLYEKQQVKNYAAISREMGWFNEFDRHHCSEEVKRHLDYARRLIDATVKNQLYEEACKPVNIGKKRKNTGDS